MKPGNMLCVGLLFLLLSTLAATSTHAFIVTPYRSRVVSSTKLGMVGFGAKQAADLTKAVKLKARKQWNRYLDMKEEKEIRVAVRKLNKDGTSDPDGEWLEVGRVKSKDNEFTAMAVARQKEIIADHAQRLFTTVSFRAVLDMAYRKEEPEEKWVIVKDSALEDAPKNLPKMVGFEGVPDPESGYYCWEQPQKPGIDQQKKKR
eukprot:CAMPEP_0116861618 /NCGR_PEP_ID=MMETSP0418-20121206/23137_1 /TAXON_ID=1158023 /ORGANISM="Astrosyne radiata, Strain 13vi08-1A" /LENGTH=202 /DNA_ID=CAMNT_0004496289 /DNA_START=687 /DNA_END=1295 /DNA_ORIENTATION=+